VREQHPDLIFFTGDTVVNRAGVPLARKVLTELSQIAPVYAVAGTGTTRSLDTGVKYPRSGIFCGHRVHYLYDDLVVTDVRGTRLWIAALTSTRRAHPALLEPVPQNEFSVLLYHTPDEVESAEGMGSICTARAHARRADRSATLRSIDHVFQV